MAEQAGGYLDIESLSTLHWLAAALAIATGVLHVVAGLSEGRIPVLLAGVGFVVAVGLFLADYRRPVLYLVGIPYTAIQFPLWYVARAGEFTALGYADKVIQALLIVALAVLYWRQRQVPGRAHGSSAA
jgi:hypothetical protein